MQIDPRRLRLLRERRGWNQTSLAEAAKLSRVYIGQIEAGIRNPSPPAVEAIRAALGCTIDELMPFLVVCPHCGTRFTA